MIRQLRAVWAKARGLVQRDHQDREITAELESHIAHHIDDNLRAGMSQADARRLALARLGGIEQAKERHRDARGFLWVEDARRDAWLAFRQFRRNPLFALSAILILTAGIGANQPFVLEMLEASPRGLRILPDVV